MRRTTVISIICIAVLSCGCGNTNESEYSVPRNTTHSSEVCVETTLVESDDLESAVIVDEEFVEPPEIITIDESLHETETFMTIETEFVTTLPYMRTIQFDGDSLTDGIYLLSDIQFDNDLSGCTAHVWGHNYLLEEDIELLSPGDRVYYLDYWYSTDSEEICEFTISQIYNDGRCVSSGLVRQFNGQYFLLGEDDADITTPEYTVVENYHLNFSDRVLIFDNWDIYHSVSEEIHQRYISGEGVETSYADVESFAYDWEYNSSRHPMIYVVVCDETIVEMYINPQLHQDWHAYIYE